MLLRTGLSAVSVFLLLTGSAIAVDYRDYTQLIHKAGWDMEALEAQTQSTVFLRAQIDKLRKENEQLKISISRIRKQAQSTSNTQSSLNYDARVQALVEENTRLSRLLEAQNNRPAPSGQEGAYDSLIKENRQLRASLQRVIHQNKMSEDESSKKEAEKQSKQVAQLQSRISSLKSEHLKEKQILNKALAALRKENTMLLERQAALITQDSQDDAHVQKQTDMITSLQETVLDLRQKNRELSKKLTALSQKVLSETSVKNETAHYKKVVAEHKEQLQEQAERIKTLQGDNAALSKKLEKVKAEAQKSDSKALSTLKKQNNSLRETIRAQNEVLVSLDNASKNAHNTQMKSARLTQRLQSAEQAVKENERYAKKFWLENKALKKQLAEKDNVIAAYEAQRSSKSEQSEEEESLKMALEKERNAVILYRKKIREYQDQLTEKEEALAALERETKQNNAALLEKNGQKKAAYNSHEADNAEIVKYVDAPYPSPEKVRPILNEEGKAIRQNLSFSQPEALVEDLLQQEPKPISTQ